MAKILTDNWHLYPSIQTLFEIWFSLNVICCIVTSKNIDTCKICSINRGAGYILDMYIKTTWLCVLISYFGSVYLQEFFCWELSSPPPPVISNGRPLNLQWRRQQLTSHKMTQN